MTINTPKYSIMCVAFATLLIGLWGELFTAAPTIVKIIYSALTYSSILLIPWANARNNDFSIWGNFLLSLIITESILQICMSIYNTDPDMYAHGNKWITLFLNEYTVCSLFPPVFTYLSSKSINIPVIVQCIGIYIAIALLLSPIQTNNIAFLPIFFVAFFPYIKTKQKIFYIFVIIISLLTAIQRVRMLMIVNMFSFAALIMAYILRNKIVSYLLSTICVIIPFIIFIPILSLAKGELSFFQQIMEYLAQNHYIDDTNDTRTLLYLEIAEDINANDTWFWGKGAYCHYYSRYFSFNEGDDPIRTLVEVPFLYMILRGGLVYTITYYTLLLTAIIKGLIWGKNKFVHIATILIIGWYFNSFVGDLNGCRFYHLGFFFLVGCCLSKRFLSYTDDEVQLIFDEQYDRYRKLKTIIQVKILLLRSKSFQDN